MPNKSQEEALALLRTAKEQGKLEPAIEKELTELAGEGVRPKLAELLKSKEIIEPVGNVLRRLEAVHFERTAGGYNVYLQANVPVAFSIVLLDEAGNKITSRNLSESMQEELISDDEMKRCHSVLLAPEEK